MAETTPSATDASPSATATTAADVPFTSYEEALEEVHTRFVLNLPDSELATADRIFFQLEQAWWFYEDWICDTHPEWTHLPRFANLKPFAQTLFAHSPLLDTTRFHQMWAEFSQYKRKISNYGCILLSADCRQFVLCRVWNGKAFSFPAGKINQGEDGATAAARETYEETGFDVSCQYGLTASWKQNSPEKITWKCGKEGLPEKDALVYTEEKSGKRRTSFVVVGVPLDFPFEPVARKEVSEVQWFDIDDVPKGSYGVIPFLGPLRGWIKKYKKQQQRANSSNKKQRDRSRRNTPGRGSNKKSNSRNNTPRRNSGGGGSRSNSRSSSRNSSRGRNIVNADDELVQHGLAEAGDVSGWSEEDMFKANELLSGRRVEYDGNPHVFAEQGFGGKDPHAFRVVGGSFLNNESASGGIQSLAPPPDRSKLQPLFRRGDADDGNAAGGAGGDDDGELTPFFSDDGATPWGEVVDEARDHTAQLVQETKTTKQKKAKKRKQKQPKGQDVDAAPKVLLTHQQPQPELQEAVGTVTSDFDALFLTDAQVTARSQATKTAAAAGSPLATTTAATSSTTREEELERQYQEDMAYCRQWVANLPKTDLKLDIDRIMMAAEPYLNPPATG